MTLNRWRWIPICALVLCATQAEAGRQSKKEGDPPAAPASALKDEGKAETTPANRAWWPPTATVGPAKVSLEGQATLDLPADYIFLGKEDSKALMERLGNRANPNDVGTILPKDINEKKFFVTVDWDAAGYIKDDEADKLDAKEILESIREGNEEANKFREERGFKPVTVVGWGEPPRYERQLHHIVWAIIGKSEEGETVNFNTRLLGRHGYMSLNLVCGPEQLQGLKPTMADLLARTTYDPGKRYADFQQGKDRVAEFGLAALVVGGAAMAGKGALKVGLLAKFGKILIALLLALKKAIFLVILGLIALAKQLFGGKRAAPAPTPNSDPAPPSDAAPPSDPPAAP
jgi:uncharacterized membrane-anchored protein